MIRQESSVTHTDTVEEVTNGQMSMYFDISATGFPSIENSGKIRDPELDSLVFDWSN